MESNGKITRYSQDIEVEVLLKIIKGDTPGISTLELVKKCMHAFSNRYPQMSYYDWHNIVEEYNEEKEKSDVKIPEELIVIEDVGDWETSTSNVSKIESKLLIKPGDSCKGLDIIDFDRLCYLVHVQEKHSEGLRTISRQLIAEFVIYFKNHISDNAKDARSVLSGKSGIDKYEYGYDSTLRKLALMEIAKEEGKPLDYYLK